MHSGLQPSLASCSVNLVASADGNATATVPAQPPIATLNFLDGLAPHWPPNATWVLRVSVQQLEDESSMLRSLGMAIEELAVGEG